MIKRFILSALLLSGIPMYAQQPSDSVIPVYANRLNFDLTRLGYEHIKPSSFYGAAECWYVLGFDENDLKFILAQIEGRLGYNFSLTSKNTLTPFIGGGYFKSFETHKKQEIGYPSIGLRYEHIFGTIFNMGLNTEVMLGYSLNNTYVSWGDPIWGLDISVPFTWRFTKTRRWDFRLEPFFTKWFGEDREVAFAGGRSTIGYRF